MRSLLQRLLMVLARWRNRDIDYMRVLCPWHKEYTGSCHVDYRRGCVFCFGCGKDTTVEEYRRKLDEIRRSREQEVRDVRATTDVA